MHECWRRGTQEGDPWGVFMQGIGTSAVGAEQLSVCAHAQLSAYCTHVPSPSVGKHYSMRDALYPLTHSKNSGAFSGGALLPALWPFSKQPLQAMCFCR